MDFSMIVMGSYFELSDIKVEQKVTGPTLTNVNDFRAVLIEKP
jgi:glycerate-2-kinase